MDFPAGMFYIWWLLINAFYSFAEYDFFSRFAFKKTQTRYLLLYIGIICTFTIIELTVRPPVLLREFLHAVIMYIFMARSFKCKKSERITPIIIIFSLETFMEGISAILMRWIVARITESAAGNIIQMSLTVVLALLFYLILRYAASWHKSSAGQAASSYLYMLLLPCTFIVWVVRFGFGLDNTNLTNAGFPFSGLPLAWALAAMTGAAVTFFIVLNVFESIMTLSQQKTEKALLDNQLREQKIYLAEAQKRDEQLSSFQHDIDNHLSVLSGLLKDKKYSDAERYFQKLQLASASLRCNIRTGNAVLDVLLREKIGYAQQNQIAVSCRASLPHDLPVDDMDLCIIISNALDNAIQACIKITECQPDIDITIKARHQFLLIEITNTAPSMAAVTPGTGLQNVVSAAEKYLGTTEIKTDNGRFRISVLLCLTTNISPDTQKK